MVTSPDTEIATSMTHAAIDTTQTRFDHTIVRSPKSTLTPEILAKTNN